jgi:hypothetical protein
MNGERREDRERLRLITISREMKTIIESDER